jgi:hypothetical protein
VDLSGGYTYFECKKLNADKIHFVLMFDKIHFVLTFALFSCLGVTAVLLLAIKRYDGAAKELLCLWHCNFE